MVNFNMAVASTDVDEVVRSGRAVAQHMDTLAASLERETDPVAVAARDAFKSCSAGFAMAADAVDSVDSDALYVATDLIERCADDLELMGVIIE